MKITLYYDFEDELYYDFPDSVEVTCKGYEYTTTANPMMTLDEIYKENRQLALREAAFKYMNDLGEFINAKN